LEAKENPLEVEGLGAVADGVEPNENVGLGVAFEAVSEFEANAMLANGFGLDGGSSDDAFGFARVVEAKGLIEAAGLGAAGAGAGVPDPFPPPNFRLDTLKILRCLITS